MLIVKPSGAGKATIVTNLVEHMRNREFQFCLVDPEGNYAESQGTVVIGSAKREPDLTEVVRQLESPDVSVVLNLQAIEPQDRPRLFARFVPEIAKLRAKSGRPHWIVVDEAHQLLPARRKATPIALPQVLPGTIAATAHPEEVAPSFLKLASLAIAVGNCSRGLIEAFRDLKGQGLFKGQSDDALNSVPMYLWKPNGPLEVIHVEQSEARVMSSVGVAGRTDLRRSNSR
jgi:hypothetical protein